jgi:hypothetical protein
MIPIGNRPILWHIMKGYAQYGFTEFILCPGAQGLDHQTLPPRLSPGELGLQPDDGLGSDPAKLSSRTVPKTGHLRPSATSDGSPLNLPEVRVTRKRSTPSVAGEKYSSDPLDGRTFHFNFPVF